MNVAELVQQGPLQSKHVYMATMTSCETADHTLSPPAELLKLAASHPSATLVRYGDGSYGITAGNSLLAAELPDPMMRPGAQLSAKSWRYLSIAAGDDPNTYAGRK